MADFKDLEIQVGCLEDGRWLAATGSAPYFCLEAGSEDAVVELATRAVRFYHNTLKNNAGKLPTNKATVGKILVKRTIQAGDLIAA